MKLENIKDIKDLLEVWFYLVDNERHSCVVKTKSMVDEGKGQGSRAIHHISIKITVENDDHKLRECFSESSVTATDE